MVIPHVPQVHKSSTEFSGPHATLQAIPWRFLWSATVFTLIVFTQIVAPHTGCGAQEAAAPSQLGFLDVAQLRTVTSVSLSPSGQHVAYLLSVPRDPSRDDNGSAWSELHVVDRTGNSRPFVTGEVSVRSIAWTPDGKSIAFLSKRNQDQHTSLYLIPIDGGEARRLVQADASISEFEFSPDGKQVALIASEKSDENLKKLKDKGLHPEVYEEDLVLNRVWIASASLESTTELKQLPLEGHASEVHWSPDGKRLAVAVASTPLIDHFYMYRRIKIVDAGSGEQVAAINNPGKLGPVRWSPDGKNLAFTSGEDINDPSNGRLMIAAATGGECRELMKDYLPNIEDIAWHGSDTLRFTAADGCQTAYGSVTLEGKRTLMVKPGGPILAHLSLSKDGTTAAFTASTPDFPAEVFLWQNTGMRRLTNNNAWLAKKKLAKQSVVRYKASDGETVEGILIHPLDYKEGTRYPLILTVHGGPESHVSNGWVTSYSNPGQLAAARGFAVFYPNYRGSTGRGVAFAKAHQADYGGREFDDLIDGIDHLIDLGLVDRDRVGVTGGSYGGFASAWCATKHSERFAASVMFVGISNQISKSGTTDIPDEMFHVHARKRIWDDWQFFLERSPVFHVQNCKTPILIMHGKDDTRVHPSQSMELYRNLKILAQAPVRLVFYPGEGHGNRKSNARFDYSMRLMRWMEHYLKGEGGDPPPTQIDYGLDEKKE